MAEQKRIDQPTGNGVAHHFGYAPDAGCDYRNATGHAFQQYIGPSLSA